ncbi:MAG TPA: aldo/keto reductase [Vicinamibacterales bacterium]|nr:aldo/keto reductase [Vicinamibacterales bacterium]
MAVPPSTALPGGESIPVLGQGTWNIAEHPRKRADEIAALQMAVDAGLIVIDTAEMYGSGAAEELVAEALGHRRRECFLVSKVLPHHASRRGTVSACEASLRRLKTEHLDLYLLHWRGSVPLNETLEGFNDLQRRGKIRYWGVSNFDVDDMEELDSLAGKTGHPVASNQVLYNVMRRGIEYDLLPWCRARGIPIMAYSPLEQGKLAKHKTVKAIAQRLDATASQVALAWVLRQPGVIAIPKAGHPEHVRENLGALELALAAEDLEELDKAFPSPARKTPLEMI